MVKKNEQDLRDELSKLKTRHLSSVFFGCVFILLFSLMLVNAVINPSVEMYRSLIAVGTIGFVVMIFMGVYLLSCAQKDNVVITVIEKKLNKKK
jgi:uncharacterized protein YacL